MRVELTRPGLICIIHISLPVEHQYLAEHGLIKSCNDCLLLLVIMVIITLSQVVNRIMPYGVFHLQGGLLCLEHVVKSKIEETVNGSISYRSIIIGFKINVVTYHLILGNELNAIEPKLEVYLLIVSPCRKYY